MLRIMNKQFEEIIDIQFSSFVVRLKQHLNDFFHETIALLTPKELDYFIKEGIKKATDYKLETEFQISVYFNIMLTFGIDFEKDEQYKWASNILYDSRTSAEIRVDELIKQLEIEIINP